MNRAATATAGLPCPPCASCTGWKVTAIVFIIIVCLPLVFYILIGALFVGAAKSIASGAKVDAADEQDTKKTTAIAHAPIKLPSFHLRRW